MHQRDEDRESIQHLEAEVERLREGIRALADEWADWRDDDWSDQTLYRTHAEVLRALLAPSPAATTGEADCYCPDDHASWCPNLSPAPVSSREAGTGEADPLEGQGYDLAPHVKADEADAWDEGFEAGVEHASGYTHGDNGPPDPPLNPHRPAAVVTPSAEGSE